jgi:dipeptidyl-peptidase-4
VKKIVLFIALIAFQVHAQQPITLEQIWGGAFRTQSMMSLQALQNTNQYTVLNFNRTDKNFQIDLYDFATLEISKTVIEAKNYKELADGIDSYVFNKAEDKILISTHSESIYRHSSVADFYLYDIQNQSLQKISDYKIQEPTFSPDGSKIAYAYQNNLYIWDIASKTSTQITTDGKKNHIINGITDWVYEEEFAFVRAFDWNKTGTHLAYVKFNETDVPEFSMDVYGSGLYPSQEVFKYPKAGEANAKVSLHIVEMASQKQQQVDLSGYDDFYIARMQWTEDANLLSAQVLNRHQNNLDLIFVDAKTAKSKVVLNEKDNAYVDVTDNLTFLKDNSFIWTSEKDGFNHIYHYKADGTLINQITKGNWEVTAFYGLDEKSKTVFYQSVALGSIYRNVYSVQISGKKNQCLTPQLGNNNATFSPDFSFFINNYSSATTAPVYTLHDSKSGKKVKEIVNNQKLQATLTSFNLPTKEFFEIKIPSGEMLNAYIIKPKDFDSTKKYPLLMFQYSGPGSQQVADQWLNSNDYWHMMLVQQGYLVACVDGRGTGFKGAAFKKMTQNELGKYEVEDQIEAAKIFGTYPYIDAKRIGIWGWSYGGFMSSNCILKGNDVFKTAIAVAPVTNWRFYDSIYTERFMTTPQENPKGYDDNSPINHVDKLKGNYLIIHGTADDNVHVQNAMRMIRALQLANKPFDQAIYPDTNHGIYGGKIRLQLYTKMTNFIKEKL